MIRIYKIKLMLIPETPTSCAAEIETLLVKFKLTEAHRGLGSLIASVAHVRFGLT
jgi:hypothetical protein